MAWIWQMAVAFATEGLAKVGTGAGQGASRYRPDAERSAPEPRSIGPSGPAPPRRWQTLGPRFGPSFGEAAAMSAVAGACIGRQLPAPASALHPRQDAAVTIMPRRFPVTSPARKAAPGAATKGLPRAPPEAYIQNL